MADIANCPHCGKSLKGIFGSSLISDSETKRINAAYDRNSPAYCKSCYDEYWETVVNKEFRERKELEKKIVGVIDYIPIMTCGAPVNWEYSVIDFVSTQISTGTGFITEISQSVNDLFGTRSRTTDRKIYVATENCKKALRQQCLDKGGNAIIGADIDYSEIGTGSSNMLMVCMAGTAIHVPDYSQLSVKYGGLIEEMTLVWPRYSELLNL